MHPHTHMHMHISIHTCMHNITYIIHLPTHSYKFTLYTFTQHTHAHNSDLQTHEAHNKHTHLLTIFINHTHRNKLHINIQHKESYSWPRLGRSSGIGSDERQRPQRKRLALEGRRGCLRRSSERSTAHRSR